MKFILVLRMQHFQMGEWLELKQAGTYVGKIGIPLSDLWDWRLGYSMPRTRSELGTSQILQHAYAQDTMFEGNKLQLAQSLGRSRLLARRSLWPMKAIPQNLKTTNLRTNISTNDGRMEEGGSTY